MHKVTLVRGARQLLTLRGASGPRRGIELRNLGLIQDGAVLIVDGEIREVGPSRRVENLALARQAEEIDASGRVVMPGFVDSHTHLVSGPARIPDYESGPIGVDALTLARGIQELAPRTLETQAMHAVTDAIRHGTTTMEAKSGFGLTEANEIKILRVHAALRKQAVPVMSTYLCSQVPPDYRNRVDQYMEWVCEHMLPLVQHRKLAEFADIHCEEGGFSIEHVRRYLLSARELGFGLKIHMAARPTEGVVRLAAELGVSSVDHAISISPEEMALLAQSQTIATLLPGPVFYLGSPECICARTLIEGGVAVGLATDYNPATSPSQNMQMMIALACVNMRMTAAEAVTAATINAACALRRDSRAGSLEPGKSADLLILSVADYREIPYHFGLNLVELVMKDGTVLVEKSEVKWPNGTGVPARE